MKDITKLILAAGVSHLLHGKELEEVRAKFDTDRLWEDLREVAGRIEDNGVEFTVAACIEALEEVLPEYRLSETPQAA